MHSERATTGTRVVDAQSIHEHVMIYPVIQAFCPVSPEGIDSLIGFFFDMAR